MSFSPSAKFQGSRSGYVFKLDSLGLGYYRDGVIGQDEEKLEVSHTHDKVHNQQRERHRDRSVTDTESDRRRRSSRSRSPHRDSLSSERQQAQSGKVSFEESDEFAPEITAVMLAERQLEMFNARRLVPFLECFHSDLIVEVLSNGRSLYPSFAAFRSRYACVFANSDGRNVSSNGHSLKCEVKKRIFLDPTHVSPSPPIPLSSFCIDFQRISHLVRPQPPSFDGSAGVLYVASTALIVMYQALAGKIRHMWIADDSSGIVDNADVSESHVLSSPSVKALFEKAQTVSGQMISLTPHYHAYHEIETWS